VNLSIQLFNTAFDYIAFGTLVNKHDTSKSSASNNKNSVLTYLKIAQSIGQACIKTKNSVFSQSNIKVPTVHLLKFYKNMLTLLHSKNKF